EIRIGSSDQQPAPPALVASDEGSDLLTCGQCSQAFPLAHILAFIQHKQGGCRSRNQASNTRAAPPSPANRAQQRIANTELEPGFIELRRGAARDREPSYFTCQQCEGVFPSAWAVLQHAQHTHSFSIYQEDEDEDTDMRSGRGEIKDCWLKLSAYSSLDHRQKQGHDIQQGDYQSS
uniref:C2H2-type domain-containing protein n=1 Tax=Sphaeramia orbicularis TaxID=375764 RepID=A0A673B3B8_9TELE